MAQPLRRQIIALNAMILLPVVAVTLWTARQTYLEQIRHLQDECNAMAAVLVVYLQRGVDIPALQKVIETVPLPEGSVITVTDDRGVVLARSRERERYVGQTVENGAAPVADVPRTVIRAGMDGVERAFANHVFEGGPWIVSVGIPTAVAAERASPVFWGIVILTIGVTFGTLLLEFVIVRRYIQAFDRAIESSARVASGDLTLPAAIQMPSLEMEQLQGAFIDMVTKLRAAREAVSTQMAEERRMREEVESLQRQVIRQERLAAIGVLVSGVAHELNNPLQAILGFAELLQMRKDSPDHMRRELQLIQKESARASGIIRNLSRYGRPQTSEPSPVRLHDVVASVIELRQRQFEENGIDFELHNGSQRPVTAIFTELQQVVLNFVINAEHAVMNGRRGPKIVIRTLDARDRVRLEVEDSGPGVPREHESKLFQPFFTTKPVGGGTGLGLSVSYGIIQLHGGVIGYKPAPDGGAIFFFELPAAT